METTSARCELDDVEKMELQECYSAVRLFLQRRTQLVVFFGAANLTLLGLAIQYESSLLLMASGSVLLLFVVVDFLVLQNLAPYLLCGLRLEWRAGRELGLLNCEVLSHSRGLGLREALRALAGTTDSERLREELRRLIPNPFSFRGYAARIVTVFAAAQILAGLLAPFLVGWSWIVEGSP